MYHHIQDIATDPWETSVREIHFREHLGILEDEYKVLPLTADGCRVGLNSNKRKKIFISFDDGYLDNYERAVPELMRHGFPATFYIPTQILDGKEFFWWELVDHLFWEREELPEVLALHCSHGEFTRTLSSTMREGNFRVERNWSANSEPPPTERCRLYLELCGWVKERSWEDQQFITRQLMDICAVKQITASRKMSVEQLRQISADGFEAGAHTVHHPALGFQSREVQRLEITRSKYDLEMVTGKLVSAIAYPHGHFNADTISVTKEAGYTLACTTEMGCVRRNSDLFLLPRIWVKDVDGVGFQRMLSDLFKQ